MCTIFSETVRQSAITLLDALRKRALLVTTAESCTGGLLSALLTERPGASAMFERGFVTYSNAAKFDQLGVSEDLIARHGAVSAEVAGEMATGALAHSSAHIALSITGIAGPDGGTPEKPVGLVYFGAALKDRPVVTRVSRFGSIGRHEIRMASVAEALALGLVALNGY